MLTEDDVRDLLHRAADTVDVAPASAIEARRRSWWPLVAVAASVALVLGGAAVAGSVVAHHSTVTPTSEDPGELPCSGVKTAPDDTPSLSRGPDFPTNASGLTYGSGANDGAEPDLIGVVGDCGRAGYVYRDELEDPAPWAPQAGSGAPRAIAVYESDGTTQIDTFTIGGSEAQPEPTEEPPSGAAAGPGLSALQGDWSVTIAGMQNANGAQQFDTFRDLALTATVSGNSLRVFDGCMDSTAAFRLTDGEFGLTAPFHTDYRGPDCGVRQAPLTQIIENVRHVTRHRGETYLSLDSYQIVLVLKRVDE